MFVIARHRQEGLVEDHAAVEDPGRMIHSDQPFPAAVDEVLPVLLAADHQSNHIAGMDLKDSSRTLLQQSKFHLATAAYASVPPGTAVTDHQEGDGVMGGCCRPRRGTSGQFPPVPARDGSGAPAPAWT